MKWNWKKIHTRKGATSYGTAYPYPAQNAEWRGAGIPETKRYCYRARGHGGNAWRPAAGRRDEHQRGGGTQDGGGL